MRDYGYLRIMACSPRVRVADVRFNCETITEAIEAADAARAALVVFPELSLTGYTCGDLFGQNLLIDKAEEAAKEIVRVSRAKAVTIVVGVPVRFGGHLYNCAAVIRNGRLKGLVPKTYLPTYNEVYEGRWFASGAAFLGSPETVKYAGQTCVLAPAQLFSIGKASFAVELCEDLWTPVPPSSCHALAGAEVIVNLSASNEVLLKHTYRRSLVAGQSARTVSAYVYCGAGYGESTQDVVFAGSSFICENGTFLAENERFRMDGSSVVADVDIEKLTVLRQKENTFQAILPDGHPLQDNYLRVDLGEGPQTDFEEKLYRTVDPHPFVPDGDAGEIDRRAREVLSIQVTGLVSRLEHIGCRTAVIGISGGLDSTLALLVTALAFDQLGWSRDRILGITMPGLGTSGRTKGNAVDLMAALGVSAREISVVPAVEQHFKDIGHDPKVLDATYENAQARERTQILMDVANQENGIVIGTGDLSELALGWCTYNGDQMSMYGVNAGVPKTLVIHLVRWAAENRFGEAGGHAGRPVREILLDIVDTPISPELTPSDASGAIAQKTEDLVGPYELHDFFLYHFFRFGTSPAKLYFLARKAFGDKYDADTLRKWLRKFYWRFFSQQFKRSALPDGPKVGSVSLSPRGDWRMPSDAKSSLFLAELDTL